MFQQNGPLKTPAQRGVAAVYEANDGVPSRDASFCILDQSCRIIGRPKSSKFNLHFMRCEVRFAPGATLHSYFFNFWSGRL